MPKYTHGGLFEGIGSFTYSAKENGISTLWVTEIDRYRREILKANNPNLKCYVDIRKQFNPPPVDILTGGFPCQDISIAGAIRGIVGERSGLWSEFYRIITETRPPIVIIENSPMLLQAGLEYVLYDLSQAGYNAEWQCLQAKWFYYPHKRERVFIAAYPMQIGNGRVEFFAGLSELFSTQEISSWRHSAETFVYPSLLRIKCEADFEHVRLHDGVSAQLDSKAISAIGDSIPTRITDYLMRCAIKFLNTTQL